MPSLPVAESVAATLDAEGLAALEWPKQERGHQGLVVRKDPAPAVDGRFGGQDRAAFLATRRYPLKNRFDFWRLRSRWCAVASKEMRVENPCLRVGHNVRESVFRGPVHSGATVSLGWARRLSATVSAAARPSVLAYPVPDGSKVWDSRRPVRPEELRV
jgi:hypothetical protein